MDLDGAEKQVQARMTWKALKLSTAVIGEWQKKIAAVSPLPFPLLPFSGILPRSGWSFPALRLSCKRRPASCRGTCRRWM